MRFWFHRRKRDTVAEHFEDYKRNGIASDRSVADILAEDTEAAAQLRRDLEADTEAYLEDQWAGIRRRFRRDWRFRLATRRALKTKPTI